MILLTGASGFLGKTIQHSLGKEKLKTLSRMDSDYSVFLNKDVPVFNSQFEIIIHSAGKAHSIPKTVTQKKEYFDINVTGTSNLLQGLENSMAPKSFIFLSTVAVYGAKSGKLINEERPLAALDPYGRSKLQAEKLIWDWCQKNEVICTILRLPLIAGPNPPGNLSAMIKGIQKGYYFNIAGGNAKKSVALAEDVAKIIPVAANIGGIYNLTDGYHPSFSELSELIAKQLNKKKPANIPLWLAKSIAKVGDLLGTKAPLNSDKLKKITSDLTFDDSKARELLGWNPTPVLKGFKIA